MKPPYIVFGVVAVAVVGWWVAFVRPETEPMVPDYDSPTMVFEQKKATADLLYQRAVQDGNYDPAIAAYKDALSVRPENSLAHNDLGSVYYVQGLDKISRPVDEDLREGEALVQGDLTRYSSDPADTIEYMRRKLAGSPSGKYVWDVPSDMVTHIEAFVRRTYPAAEFEKHLVIRSHTVTIRIRRSADAVMAHMRETIDEAVLGKFTWMVSGAVAAEVETFLKTTYPRALVQSNPADRDEQFVVVTGEVAELFRNAEVHFWRALDAKPEYPPPYRNLGALYVQVGRFEEAKRLFAEALQLEPNDQELQTYIQQL